MRRQLRDLLDGVMASRAKRAMTHDWWRACDVILAFHNVIPDHVVVHNVDTSLHMRLSSFMDLIHTLGNLPSIDFVDLDEITRPGTGSSASVRVHITFDDAYLGAMQNALPTLIESGIPSTVFVSPAMLGGHTPWWDRVAGTTKQEAAWTALREKLLAPPYSGLYERIDSVAQDVAALPLEYLIADLPTLRTAAESGLVRFGCHTMHHACLPSLTDEQLMCELLDSQRWLANSGLPPCRAHAFPYGRFGRREKCVLRGLGYEHALAVEGGAWTRQAGDLPFVLPRINVPSGMTPNGLVRRLALSHRQACLPERYADGNR